MNKKTITPIDLRPKVFARAHDGGRSIQHFINLKERYRSSHYWMGKLAIKSDVVAVTGTGAVVSVDDGMLVIKQGYVLAGDSSNESTRYTRGDNKINYIVIDSRHGYITFDAIQWCDTQNVGIILHGREPLIIHSSLKPATDLRRRQYLAHPLPIAKWILREKFKCMLRNFPLLPMRDGMKECIDGIGLNADSLNELRSIEGRNAGTYWRYHSFELKHFARFPKWWAVFDQRASNFGTNKNATHPMNAIFNYAYSVVAGMTKRHAVMMGLDTALGSLHADKDRRDSLVYDLLELVRSDIDGLLLPWMKQTKWRRTDFIVSLKGVVSLETTLARVVVQKVAPVDKLVKQAVKRYVVLMLKA